MSKAKKSNNIFETYFKKVFDIHKRGDATEPSFYSSLEELFQGIGKQQNRNIHVTSLPKKTDGGNPDFRVWDGKDKIIGYIEAKPIETKHLETMEHTDQLKRYLETFPNLILTNFFEFRHYREGKLINRVELGRPFLLLDAKTIPQPINEEKFCDVLNQFFSFSIPKTYTAKALAIELAKRTRFLRDQVIAEELKEEEQKEGGFLLDFYKAFKEHLISSLTPKDFANLYAQTITYGLFAARSRAENGFNRRVAYDCIPQTIGILRDVFKFISFGDPKAERIKIFLPTTLEKYAEHYRKHAHWKTITPEQAENLINQLTQLKQINPKALIENPDTNFTEEAKKAMYYERNSRIVEASDELVAFRIKTEASEGMGTADTIEKARKKGICVKPYSYDLTK